MSLIYIGAGKETLHLQPGSSWSKSDEGLDILDETYAGPIPAYDNWIKSFQLGVVHSEYKAMYLVSHPREIGRSFVEVRLSWIGMKGGDKNQMPPHNVSRRTSIKTASISTDSPEVAHRDITYSAPEVVYTYATNKKILLPQFKTPKDDGDEDSLRVMKSIITTEEGKRYPGNAPAPLVVALYVTPGWYFTGLDSTQIKHTPFWTNSENWAFEFPSS